MFRYSIVSVANGTRHFVELPDPLDRCPLSGWQAKAHLTSHTHQVRER